MSQIEDKLKQLGIQLPPAPKPVANYLSCKQMDKLLFVSGRKSTLTGRVDEEVSEADAKNAARETVILLLAIIKEELKDLDKIDEVVKVHGFIRSSAGFGRQPMVLDGATELLIDLFGANGKHARTATGVSELPFGSTIQIDMILKLK